MNLLLSGLAIAAACVAVEADKVTAADLSRVLPAFAAAPPEADFGYAPAPGARRVYPRKELERLARRHGISLSEAADVCVVRPLERLTAGRLAEAMRASLGSPQARIEIVEYAAFGAPRGVLEFPASGLRRPPANMPDAAVLWKGHVRYAGNRRFPVWARVRLRAPGVRVVAIDDLRPGAAIRAEQLRLEEGEWFPETEAVARSIEQVEGRMALRAVAAGREIPLGALAEPRDVERGERVQVKAVAGAASVSVEGVAAVSGSRGQTITVKNPSTGKAFRATVVGRGSAQLRVSEGGGEE